MIMSELWVVFNCLKAALSLFFHFFFLHLSMGCCYLVGDKLATNYFFHYHFLHHYEQEFLQQHLPLLACHVEQLLLHKYLNQINSNYFGVSNSFHHNSYFLFTFSKDFAFTFLNLKIYFKLIIFILIF